MAGNPLPFNFSTLSLKVLGEALTVIKLDGTEALSMPFHFKIDALIDRFLT